MLWEERAERIRKEFRINTELTEEVRIKDLKVFKVKNLNTFLVYTNEGRKIACYPSLVGKELDKLSFKAALKATKAIKALVNFEGEVVFEHVLRAALGYNLHKAFKAERIRFREVFIRPKYEFKSYRQHRVRKLRVVYKDFKNFPSNKRITLIKPDTEATGATAKVSLIEALKESEKRNSRIEKVILYGFISLPALKLLKKLAKKFSFDLIAFAIGNLTPLAFNRYDMPFYGIDESYYKEKGKIKKLGCITDFFILKKYLPFYIPGCDQPGDWSARQEKVFNGNAWEKIDLKIHLKNSVKLIKSLLSIPGLKEWQIKIAKKELERLNKKLATFHHLHP